MFVSYSTFTLKVGLKLLVTFRENDVVSRFEMNCKKDAHIIVTFLTFFLSTLRYELKRYS